MVSYHEWRRTLLILIENHYNTNIMRVNKKYIFTLCFVFLSLCGQICANRTISLKSPNNKIEVKVSLNDDIHYSVWHSGQKLLDESKIALELSDGIVLGKTPKLIICKTKLFNEKIVSPFYRNQSFTTEYNEANLKFKGNFGIIFRVYNEGVAYRFYTTSKKYLEIKDEVAEFNFDKDYTTYLSHSTNKKEPFAMAFQNIYEVKSFSQGDSTLAFLPATIDFGNDKKLTILESDLESYPGMFLQIEKGKNSLNGVFAKLPSAFDYYPWRHQKYVTERTSVIAKTKGNRSYPWRVLAISENDAQMPTNNLVYALASPNRIGDYSWINPGKSAWEWWNDWGLSGVNFKAGINMETYKYYIDFASRYGLEYVILDEGWYDPKSGDMLTVIQELNMSDLVQYAKDKGVGVILWTVFNVLDNQLEEACKQYAAMGVKGFKVDFLDRDDQEAVEMVYRIAEATAHHQLLLDLHGIYKPTGINRTYPNIVNFEGVFGMEEAKWSTIEKDMPQYNVTFPFIRMMAGPVDFTQGAMRNASKKDFQPVYYNPMSQGTRCHQLATYIVYDSPFTMLCDSPVLYEKEGEYTRFLSSIPVDIDETRILSGKMGEYIVSARRKEADWYVGGLTNWTARDLKVSFSFLETGKKYKAILYKDGINSEKQASDYQKSELIIDNSTELDIHLAPGGGFAISISRELKATNQPTAVPDALGLDHFYKKYLDAEGIPVVSSEKVRDEALTRAQQVISQILSKRADLKKIMVDKGCKVMIIGEKEEVCEIPEYAHICDTPQNIAYWNKRARGFGGAPEHDLSASCGEENVLGLEGDRYRGESILVHEFAHIIHMVGLVNLEPDFDSKLEALRQNAIAKGLWKDTYAITNKEEYFAESVQSFFNCNQFSLEPNGVHNAINTREKLKVYDPGMYEFLLQYFPEIDLCLVTTNKYK